MLVNSNAELDLHLTQSIMKDKDVGFVLDLKHKAEKDGQETFLLDYNIRLYLYISFYSYLVII